MTSSARAATSLEVKTDRGKVAGKTSADGKVRIFLGLPYAAPPVGKLRWTAPKPPEKWHGVRQTTEYGYRCMQPPVFKDMIFHDPGQSEDCLTLNIWTPAKDKHAKLPVMVWIYGGGFLGGTTSEARQDGERLARKGVVVLSMNYRLGIFGFFAHQALAAESEHHAAGNYGLLDQAAAIMWARKNIAAFGGDPANITIFGESAGSFSVSAQMASPLTKDLIRHAIGESGGAMGRSALSFPPLEVAEKDDEAFAKEVLGTDDLAALRAMSADQLLNAGSKSGGPMIRFRPDVDGYFLPESVAAIYAAGKQAHVPLLAGWNHDEGGLNPADPAPTVASLRAMAQARYGPDADEFLASYAAANDDEAVRVAKDYAGDQFIAFSTWAWIEAQVKTGGQPVYRYRFDRPSPGDEFHPASAGAFHSDDIEYVFGNLDSRRGAKWSPEDYRLSELMQTYWTNFARTGDPSGAGLPPWPAYNSSTGWQVMHLDATPQARPDLHRARDLFLEKMAARDK